MELTMTNGFRELSHDEMYNVEGGGLFAIIGAGIVKGCTVAGASVGLGPVGGGILIGVCVVAIGVGVYAACNS